MFYYVIRSRRGEKRGYAGKAEYFGVYSPEMGKVYMVSVEIAPKTAMHLRFKSAGRRVGNSRDGFKQRSYEEVTDSPKGLTKRLAVHILIQRSEYLFE